MQERVFALRSWSQRMAIPLRGQPATRFDRYFRHRNRRNAAASRWHTNSRWLPRHIALAPGSRLLYACNQRSDVITTFRVDEKDGCLTFTGKYLGSVARRVWYFAPELSREGCAVMMASYRMM